MNRSIAVPLAALTILIAACPAPQTAAPPRPDEAAIRTALTAEIAMFGPALAAKNDSAIADMFTGNATWILPNASTFTGRAKIREGAKAFFGSFESFAVDQMNLDKLVVVSDSEAVTFAHANYTMTVKGKPPVHGVNPFADHWRKGTDGAWRVTYEINADGPAAAPASH